MTTALRRPRSKAKRAAAPRVRERLTVGARREQLLALGLTAFTAQPYDEVSLDEIARAAGVSRALIFHYFPTKRDFYMATLQAAIADFLAATVESKADSPLERLFLGLDAYFDYVERHAVSYAAIMRGGIGSDPEISKMVDSTRTHILEKIRVELPEQARDAPQLRTALRGWIGFMEATALDWIDHRDVSHEELKELALRTLAALLGEHAALFVT